MLWNPSMRRIAQIGAFHDALRSATRRPTPSMIPSQLSISAERSRSDATMMCCTPAASYAATRARSSPRSRPSQFTRVEMVKSAPGRYARRRCTIAAVCSGVSREPCQPSARRIVRRSAASELPPIHSGIGAMGSGVMVMSVISAGM